MIFQLLATKLLTSEIVDRKNVMCILARSKQVKYEFVYEDLFSWEGFKFHQPTRGAVHASSMEVVTAVKKAQRIVEDIF